MNRQDHLWKAILEAFFYEFLEFHYHDFAKKVDVKRDFEFLDKDLPKIIPEAKEEHRKADKVVKVFLKDGTEQWIIVHIEVQGYKDPDFAKRMFIYYYRLWEKFGKPIASLVIYSDRNNQNRINKYEVACLNTSLVYNFDIYAIADRTVEEYDKIDSPIAIIYQVALMGLQRNLADEELLTMKVQLFRKMYEKGYGKEQIRQMSAFIKEYTNFSKKEFFSKFDEETAVITNTNKATNMDVVETVKFLEREKGMEEGMEKGAKLMDYLTDIESDIKMIRLAVDMNLQVADIASRFKYDSEFTEKLIKIIQQNKFTVFFKTITGLRKKIVKGYDLIQLKVDLAKVFLTYDFTAKTVSQTLNLSLKKVQTIQKNLTKK